MVNKLIAQTGGLDLCRIQHHIYKNFTRHISNVFPRAAVDRVFTRLEHDSSERMDFST